MDGTYTAVVDRIVDGENAVILLEEDGEVIEQLDIPADQLPAPVQEDGGVVAVTVQEGALESIEYLPETTQKRRQSAQRKLDRLSKPLSDRDEE